MIKTIRNIFKILIILLFLTGCKPGGTEGNIVNNSDETLIISGFHSRDTLLPPQSSIFISNHPFQEWVTHKSTCCPCELVLTDGFIKPLNKAKKMTKNIHNEIEWKKVPAGKHTSLNCKLIIYQHDIIN